jgi:hypothetical protein
MPEAGVPRPSGAQSALVAATGLCYLVGYPVALFANAALGWTLVTLGGVFLLSLGVVTIRRIHRGV